MSAAGRQRCAGGAPASDVTPSRALIGWRAPGGAAAVPRSPRRVSLHFGTLQLSARAPCLALCAITFSDLRIGGGGGHEEVRKREGHSKGGGELYSSPPPNTCAEEGLLTSQRIFPRRNKYWIERKFLRFYF